MTEGSAKRFFVRDVALYPQVPHEEDALERANRHIADAMRRIADQRACIDMLRRDGHRTVEAEELLALFETSLALMLEYRDRILRDLGRDT
jgi:hypothetical protein